MKNPKATGLVFVALGMSFLALGISTQRAFTVIAVVFFILAIIQLSRAARASKE